MAQPFPNEVPIQTHDVIELTEQGMFSSFEEALQDTNTGQSQTKRDYEFRLAGPAGNIILAKPRKTGNLWAYDGTTGSPNGGEWVENAQYDPSTGGVDASQTPQHPPAVPPGTCPSCGATGVSGKFCNSCGDPLGQTPSVSMSGNLTPLGGLLGGPQVVGVGPGGAQIGVGFPAGPPPVPVAGPLAPGQTPTAGAGAQSFPSHGNPNRMEGKPKKELVVPEGMTRVSKSTGFADALDAMLAEAEVAEK